MNIEYKGCNKILYVVIKNDLEKIKNDHQNHFYGKIPEKIVLGIHNQPFKT